MGCSYSSMIQNSAGAMAAVTVSSHMLYYRVIGKCNKYTILSCQNTDYDNNTDRWSSCYVCIYICVCANNLNDPRHCIVIGSSSLFCMDVCDYIINVFRVHSLNKRFLILCNDRLYFVVWDCCINQVQPVSVTTLPFWWIFYFFYIILWIRNAPHHDLKHWHVSLFR